MLFRVVLLLSGALSVIGYVTNLYHNIILIPIVFFGCFLLITLLWCIGCFICTRFIDMNKNYDTHSRLYRYFTNEIIDYAAKFLRVRVHVSGMKLLPEEKFLFVGNHRSLIDPMLTMSVLRKYRMGFVAKQVVFQIPIICRLMHRCNCLCLNRENLRDSAKCISKAAEHISTGRASMGIYPEGERNLESDELLPFMHGAFKIAKKAKCLIVVGVIRNAGNISKNFPLKRTDVFLDFLEVLDKDYVMNHSTTEISNTARSIMEKRIKEFS